MQLNSITTFNKMLTRVNQLYQTFAPNEVKNCKNRHVSKQSDEVVLTYYLFGLMNSYSTLIGAYRLSKGIFGIDFPSESRFYRTINKYGFMDSNFMQL